MKVYLLVLILFFSVLSLKAQDSVRIVLKNGSVKKYEKIISGITKYKCFNGPEKTKYKRKKVLIAEIDSFGTKALWMNARIRRDTIVFSKGIGLYKFVIITDSLVSLFKRCNGWKY